MPDAAASSPATPAPCALPVLIDAPADPGTTKGQPATHPTLLHRAYQSASAYFSKYRGLGKPPPPLPALSEVFWSCIGAFIGIVILASTTYNGLAESSQFTLLVGSMGATAVLVYAAPTAPLSQPRNVIGGHVVSAVVGVAIRILIGDMACGGSCAWLSSALAVSLSICAMLVTGTLHPPGGATALIAATAEPGIRRLGWWFLLFPSGFGGVIMVAVGLVVNNLSPQRTYPQRWL